MQVPGSRRIHSPWRRKSNLVDCSIRIHSTPSWNPLAIAARVFPSPLPTAVRASASCLLPPGSFRRRSSAATWISLLTNLRNTFLSAGSYAAHTLENNLPCSSLTLFSERFCTYKIVVGDVHSFTDQLVNILPLCTRLFPFYSFILLILLMHKVV